MAKRTAARSTNWSLLHCLALRSHYRRRRVFTKSVTPHSTVPAPFTASPVLAASGSYQIVLFSVFYAGGRQGGESAQSTAVKKTTDPLLATIEANFCPITSGELLAFVGFSNRLSIGGTRGGRIADGRPWAALSSFLPPGNHHIPIRTCFFLFASASGRA